MGRRRELVFVVLHADVALNRLLEPDALDLVFEVLDHECEAHPLCAVLLEALDLLGVDRGGLGSGIELGLGGNPAALEHRDALHPAGDHLAVDLLPGQAGRWQKREDDDEDEGAPHGSGD